MRLTSGVYAVYYGFPGGPALRMRRSADVLMKLISHHSITSSVPPEFFGHIARADPAMDHSRALSTCVAPLQMDWNRRD